jgi:hypothetical protein
MAKQSKQLESTTTTMANESWLESTAAATMEQSELESATTVAKQSKLESTKSTKSAVAESASKSLLCGRWWRRRHFQ